jgi:O-antigen ligase
LSRPSSRIQPAQGRADDLPEPVARQLGTLEWALLLAAFIVGLAAASSLVALFIGSGLLAASWLARWLRTGRLTRATPLDLPLLLFTLSALVALWAAPVMNAALTRFYLFLAAGSVFYALANATPAGLRQAALGVVIVSALMAAAWIVLRPPASILHRNDVAGLQVVAVPVAVALLVHYTRRWQSSQSSRAWHRAGLAGVALLVMVPTPLLAGSRTVLLAAAAAVAVASWWWLAGRLRSGGLPGAARQLVFWAGLATAMLLASAVLSARPQWLMEAAHTLPGQDPTTGLGRFVLYGEAWRLAQATPLSGGGLGAFPALFSTYMHDIPNFLLAHAHNVYLNLLVEQGWPGLAAYLLALTCAVWTATRSLAQPRAANHGLLTAGAVALVMVTVHGLGDATFSASWAAPFALVPAGLIVASETSVNVRRRASGRRTAAVLAVLLAAVSAAGALTYRPLLSAWQANLGALTLARA